ncbi:hypothetical protein Hanom_Chr07g00606501 [Helianthus anomalus]
MIELPRVFYENEYNFGYGSPFWEFDQSNRSLKRGARHGKAPKKPCPSFGPKNVF